MISKKIRVLVVDDSALVRKAITDSLAADPEIEVVGSALDPLIARDKILKLNPDVLTLDIEMPRMDGITFLKILMRQHPLPVVILSSLTTAGSTKALEAMQAGAVEVLAKPSGSYSAFENRQKLVEKIKAAAHAKIKRILSPIPPATPSAESSVTGRSTPQPDRPAVAARPERSATSPIASSNLIRPAGSQNRQFSPRQLILIGASTGGTEAIKTVLVNLPPDLPGICIVQHIPAYFSTAFANRLNELSALTVQEAKNGDRLRPGLALVAPGGHHVVLRWGVNGYVVELNDGPPLHHQRPAVDVLFDSAVKAGAGPHSLAVILTGMGADGAAGMLKLRQAGAMTIAQNEETCVVFGMPREAIRMGATQQVLPLQSIAQRIDHYASEVALGRSVAAP